MKKFLIFLTGTLFITCVILIGQVQKHKYKCKHPFEVTIPINKEVYVKKRAEGAPDWVGHQIHEDLNAYTATGITPQMLDQLFQGEQIKVLSLVRFKVSKGELSFSIDEKQLQSRHFRHVLEFIKTLNALTPLPDVDFIISLEDSINEDRGCPLFVFAKNENAKSLVLIPDFKALTGYPTLRKKMEIGCKKFPWKNKSAKAFWRGSATGGWLTSLTWDQLARIQLVLQSLKHPHELDAKLTSAVQCDPEVVPLLKTKGVMGGSISQMDHLRYKYLVDVDGNSCSFERYFWSLLSNSLVLKQITPNIQWYYGALKPYVHFIPIKEDLSDLMEKYHWALTHDEEAEQIAQNATEFVKANLSLEDVFLYMDCLIREYAKLQRL